MAFAAHLFGKRSFRKQQLQKLEELALANRAIVQAKLKEVEKFENQLSQVISETKSLTISLREKLNGKLKITRNALKIICQGITEGVILVDYNGAIIELNAASETIFGCSKTEVVGYPVSELLLKVKSSAITESINLSPEFFKELSQTQFKRAECTQDCKVCEKSTRCDTFTRVLDGREFLIKLQPSGCDQFLTAVFTFSVIDNDPERLDDVMYVIFFKIAQ